MKVRSRLARKFCALLLSVAMVVTMMPSMVWALEDVQAPDNEVVTEENAESVAENETADVDDSEEVAEEAPAETQIAEEEIVNSEENAELNYVLVGNIGGWNQEDVNGEIYELQNNLNAGEEFNMFLCYVDGENIIHQVDSSNYELQLFLPAGNDEKDGEIDLGDGQKFAYRIPHDSDRELEILFGREDLIDVVCDGCCTFLACGPGEFALRAVDKEEGTLLTQSVFTIKYSGGGSDAEPYRMVDNYKGFISYFHEFMYEEGDTVPEAIYLSLESDAEELELNVQKAFKNDDSTGIENASYYDNSDNEWKALQTGNKDGIDFFTCNIDNKDNNDESPILIKLELKNDVHSVYVNAFASYPYSEDDEDDEEEPRIMDPYMFVLKSDKGEIPQKGTLYYDDNEYEYEITEISVIKNNPDEDDKIVIDLKDKKNSDEKWSWEALNYGNAEVEIKFNLDNEEEYSNIVYFNVCGELLEIVTTEGASHFNSEKNRFEFNAIEGDSIGVEDFKLVKHCYSEDDSTTHDEDVSPEGYHSYFSYVPDPLQCSDDGNEVTADYLLLYENPMCIDFRITAEIEDGDTIESGFNALVYAPDFELNVPEDDYDYNEEIDNECVNLFVDGQDTYTVGLKENEEPLMAMPFDTEYSWNLKCGEDILSTELLNIEDNTECTIPQSTIESLYEAGKKNVVLICSASLKDGEIPIQRELNLHIMEPETDFSRHENLLLHWGTNINKEYETSFIKDSRHRRGDDINNLRVTKVELIQDDDVLKERVEENGYYYDAEKCGNAVLEITYQYKSDSATYSDTTHKYVDVQDVMYEFDLRTADGYNSVVSGSKFTLIPNLVRREYNYEDECEKEYRYPDELENVKFELEVDYENAEGFDAPREKFDENGGKYWTVKTNLDENGESRFEEAGFYLHATLDDGTKFESEIRIDTKEQITRILPSEGNKIVKYVGQSITPEDFKIVNYRYDKTNEKVIEEEVDTSSWECSYSYNWLDSNMLEDVGEGTIRIIGSDYGLPWDSDIEVNCKYDAGEKKDRITDVVKVEVVGEELLFNEDRAYQFEDGDDYETLVFVDPENENAKEERNTLKLKATLENTEIEGATIKYALYSERENEDRVDLTRGFAYLDDDNYFRIARDKIQELSNNYFDSYIYVEATAKKTIGEEECILGRKRCSIRLDYPRTGFLDSESIVRGDEYRQQKNGSVYLFNYDIHEGDGWDYNYTITDWSLTVTKGKDQAFESRESEDGYIVVKANPEVCKEGDEAVLSFTYTVGDSEEEYTFDTVITAYDELYDFWLEYDDNRLVYGESRDVKAALSHEFYNDEKNRVEWQNKDEIEDLSFSLVRERGDDVSSVVPVEGKTDEWTITAKSVRDQNDSHEYFDEYRLTAKIGDTALDKRNGEAIERFDIANEFRYIDTSEFPTSIDISTLNEESIVIDPSVAKVKRKYVDEDEQIKNEKNLDFEGQEGCRIDSYDYNIFTLNEDGTLSLKDDKSWLEYEDLPVEAHFALDSGFDYRDICVKLYNRAYIEIEADEYNRIEINEIEEDIKFKLNIEGFNAETMYFYPAIMVSDNFDTPDYIIDWCIQDDRLSVVKDNDDYYVVATKAFIEDLFQGNKLTDIAEKTVDEPIHYCWLYVGILDKGVELTYENIREVESIDMGAIELDIHGDEPVEPDNPWAGYEFYTTNSKFENGEFKQTAVLKDRDKNEVNPSTYHLYYYNVNPDGCSDEELEEHCLNPEGTINIVEPGQYWVVAISNDEEGGRIYCSFDIDPEMDLYECTVNAPNVEYTGSTFVQEVKVMNGDDVVDSKYYHLNYFDVDPNGQYSDEVLEEHWLNPSEQYGGPEGTDGKIHIVEPGQYWVVARRNDASGALGACVGTFNVTKANNSYTLAPAAITDLTYNGNEQALVEEGTAKFGTVEYSLDGEHFGADIPKATDAGEYTVRYKVTGNDKYSDIGERSVTVTISPKAVTVTAQDASKVYGEDDPELKAEATGLVGEDKIEYKVTRAKGENAGEYAITASGEPTQGNYTVTYESGKFTITKAANLSLIAEGATKVYDGTALSASKIEANPSAGTTIKYSVDGGETWNSESPSITNVGTTEVKVKATNTNYSNTAEAEYTLTVTPKEVTVKAQDASKVYGEADPEFTAEATGLVGEDKIEYKVTRAKGENAGEYAITASGEPTQGNYTVTYESGKFTINRKNITITAKSANKTYGDSDPKFEAEVTGLVEGEPESLISYNISRTEGKNVGTYDINLQAAENQGNYHVALVAGKLTINPKQITVKANDVVAVWGEPDPEKLEATITGLVEGDSESLITYECTREEGTDIGDYIITVAGEDVQGNYTVTYEPGTFTIIKATNLKLEVEGASKTYDGEALKAAKILATPSVGTTIEYSVDGGDTWTDTEPKITNAGTVTVQVKATNENVDNPSTAEYVLTINKAPATVTAKSANKTYGEADPEFEAEVTGLVSGDSLNYELTRAEGENAGTYEITPKANKENPNYEVEWVPATFTINKKAVTVTAQDANKVYGEDDPELKTEVTGLVGEDTIKYSVSRAEGETVGTYAITASGEDVQGNYTVTYKAGNFTITKAENSYTIEPVAKDNLEYTGTAQALVTAGTAKFGKVLYKLSEAGSYSEQIPTAIEMGTYKVYYKVDGSDNYVGIVEASVEVTIANEIIKADPFKDIETQIYTGSEIKPELVLKDGEAYEATDYSVEYSDNVNVGTAKATVTFKGNYSGTFEKTFTITKAENSYTTEPVAKDNLEYTGTAQALVTAGTAKFGKVLYKLNDGEYVDEVPTAINAGKYTVYVKAEGTNNYTETVEDSFVVTIATKAVGADPFKDIVLEDNTYTGLEIKPELVLKDGEVYTNDDYDISYGNNVNAGTAKVVATFKGNYSGRIEKTFTIAKKKVTVSPVATTKTYGTNDPALNVNIDGLVGADTIKYKVSRAYGENVGSYKLSTSGIEEQGNYKVTFMDNEKGFTITAKPITVTAQDVTVTYGDDDPGLTANVEGLAKNDTIDYSITRAPGKDAGTYVITPSGNQEQGNYTVSYVTGIFTINKRTVTVTANNDSRATDEEDPELTASVSNLALGDDESLINYTVSREPGDSVGNYQITVTGDDEQGNYKVKYVNGLFTISSSKNLTVSTTDVKKVYNGEEQIGSVANASPSSATVKYSVDGITWTTSAPTFKNVGTYTVYVKASKDGYDDATGSYTFTMLPKQITVTANDKTMEYKGNAPEYDATVSGLIGDDTVKYALSANSDNGGTHTINVTGDEIQGNYKVDYVSGTLTVTPKLATIAVKNVQKQFGEDEPEYKADFEGFETGDKPEVKFYRTAGENVGEYTVGATFDSNRNYKVTVVSGKLTIVKAEASKNPITVVGVNRTYDGQGHSIYAKAAKGGSVLSYSSDNGKTWLETAPEFKNVGTYTVYVKAENSNYETSEATGKVVINKKDISVKVNNVIKMYGQPNPTSYRVTVDGLVEGETIGCQIGTNATQSSKVGKYGLEAKNFSGVENYNIVSNTNGTLEVVNNDTATLAVNGFEGVYDGKSHTVDAVASVEGSIFSYSTDDGTTWTDKVPEFVNAGTYKVKIKSAADNYNDTYGDAEVVINPRPITVSIDNKSKIYGTADPALTYTVAGSVIEKDKDDLDIRISRERGEDCGEYKIVTLCKNPNYFIENKDETGLFTITEADYKLVMISNLSLEKNASVDVAFTGAEGCAGVQATVNGDSVTATIADGLLTITSGSTVGGSDVTLEITGDKNHKDCTKVIHVDVLAPIATFESDEFTASINAANETANETLTNNGLGFEINSTVVNAKAVATATEGENTVSTQPLSIELKDGDETVNDDAYSNIEMILRLKVDGGLEGLKNCSDPKAWYIDDGTATATDAWFEFEDDGELYVCFKVTHLSDWIITGQDAVDMRDCEFNIDETEYAETGSDINLNVEVKSVGAQVDAGKYELKFAPVKEGEAGEYSTEPIKDEGKYMVKAVAKDNSGFQGETKALEFSVVKQNAAHVYDDAWTTDSEYHWHACTVDEGCDVKDSYGKHEWDNGVIKGYIKTYTCTVCGHTKTQNIGTVRAITTSLPLKVKQKVNITGNLKYVSGDRVVSVATSNKKIASVSGTTVKGVKKGTATITVKMLSGATTSFKIKVQKGKVKGKIAIGCSSKLTLNRGQSVAIRASKSPITCTDKLKYSSSKKKVASVSKSGVITAKKKGTATITVKCGSKKKKIKVTVR